MKLTKQQRDLILDAIAEKLAECQRLLDSLRLVHEWSGTERVSLEIEQNETRRDELYYAFAAFRLECEAADRREATQAKIAADLAAGNIDWSNDEPYPLCGDAT